MDLRGLLLRRGDGMGGEGMEGRGGEKKGGEERGGKGRSTCLPPHFDNPGYGPA